ncbi:response regulator [Natronorubrum sp. JWXQ-INN-674]|uniref:Response regulator n=1 Tax=Natronorubrum halalkaliphilum TaxID=2691917 RepID=A0A6B0VP41_9EURY|nr:response regulator [Natronorubrum halalkaliphilum]MXV62897.1 response regulator [Natronorubrum halalkaliphilum]
MTSPLVLFVEDSEFITKHVGDTLRTEHGFDIASVSTATKARSMLRSQAYDCVVTSHELPDGTGIELAASVSDDSAVADTPFVLFTGNPLESLAADALESGITAFVSKDNHATGSMDVFANRIQLVIAAHREASA